MLHKLETTLRQALAPVHLQLDDDSHKHAGHGAVGGHYRAVIVSDAFTGQTRVQRHRHVYDLLHNYLSGQQIHALQLKLFTPQEWQELP